MTMSDERTRFRSDAEIEATLENFYGPNAGYALELYERYRHDPASVDAATRTYFDELNNGASAPRPAVQPPQNGNGNGNAALAMLPSQNGSAAPDKAIVQSLTEEKKEEKPAQGTSPTVQVPHIVAGAALARAIRERGHLGARLDPLGSAPHGDPALETETHGITEDDLTRLPSNVVGGHAAAGARNALEAIKRLRAMYSGTISYQFDQVKSADERRWLRDAVGGQLYQEPRQPNSSRKMLRRLTQVEAFERYLHQTFVGQKRFSLEGTDVLVPMLDELVETAAKTGTPEVIIGMAHRGRLNVLAHVLNKPYAAILGEFSHAKHDTEDAVSESATESGISGDVKYHLGAEYLSKETNLKIILAPNPSHLEYVNPVIQGMARASQDVRTKPGLPEQNVSRSLPIVIHGDAAFPGEGIVAETMNLWNLRGYRVGGTIHIIVNNQIGFTTEPEDGRSTHFASDLAKGFEIPIIHVNADDPDAALTAVRLAKAYRDQFRRDVLVDLIGYRRWGHNEADEPAFTQPRMYETIRNHPTVREVYARALEQAGLILPGEAATMEKEAYAALEQAKREADSGSSHVEHDDIEETQRDYVEGEIVPAVPAVQLTEYNQALLNWTEQVAPNPKLARLIQRRGTTLGAQGSIDWGQAEALAFASILADGTAIRLSGQDAERGTFSHRHAVLHDNDSGATYTPLQHLPQAKASFAIYNSPISESAVLGFEYGYSVHSNDALVLWEAQFGDFANVAQVIIDQFISSGRTKWRQKSSLVLLLPHGYEGQGPEHSSARLERYLALSAGENWRVANCSTAAQYFHLLRLQAFELKHDPKALVIMSPKSLLRHALASATLSELAEGTFQTVLDDQAALQRASAIRRVVLCTGKVGIDLLSSGNRAQAEDVAVVRVELLYPFPANELTKVLSNYPNLQEVVWVQEEPRNMGAWRYMSPRLSELVKGNLELKVIARPEKSSPATGFMERFQLEQEQIIESALRSGVRELGGTNVR